MLQDFTNWLWTKVLAPFFGWVWDFVVDAAINVLDLVLIAVTSLLSLIPVPAFLGNGLGGLFIGLPPWVGYMLGALGLAQGLAMLGAAVVFRLARKIVTLGQW
jgi:hypothetical protein